MNTHRQNSITLFIVLTVGSTSCDTMPLAPDNPMASDLTATAGPADPAVGVGQAARHGFHFEVALVDDGAREIRSRILAQADRWARIVKATDLEDIRWQPGTIRCQDLEYNLQRHLVDDVIVLVSVRDRTEDGATGVGVGTCGFRDSSKLPLIGAIRLYLDGVSERDADDLILHAFGHMLGFGNSWPMLGLLRDPARHNERADPHFVGAGATATFVAAGGADYAGQKVPVENDVTWGSVDTHWRESVFGTEVMTPGLRSGVADQLSAITIQSLADIGYTVDVEQADVFILPGTSAPSGIGEGQDEDHLCWPLMSGPVVFYDRQGRAARVQQDSGGMRPR